LRASTIVGSVQNHADRRPEAPALLVAGERVTYGTLARRVGATCAWFQQRGVHVGNRVVLSASPSVSFVVAYLGVHAAGAIAVPVATEAHGQRVRWTAGTVGATFALLERRVEDMPCLCASPQDLPTARSLTADWEEPRSTEIADVLFTTGTTGTPKGVMLSHRNVCAAADHINLDVGNHERDLEAHPLPMSHAFGLGRLRCVLRRGGAVALLPDISDLSALFEVLDDYGSTGLSCTPAGLAIIERLTGQRIGGYSKQLKYIEIGSGPMSLVQKQRLQTMLPGTQLKLQYGLTEAARSISLDLGTAPEHLDTLGIPSPGVRIRIADAEGRQLATGMTGEIQIAGDHVMQGYWRDPELSRRALAGGWMHTSDMGLQDEHGFYRLLGRSSEIINVGGLKVSPVEVEQWLQKHPGIVDCACTGMADPENIRGEVVRACIVAAPSGPADRELRRYLRDKVEAYAVPVRFDRVDTIPRSSSGKILRAKLREL
jgi:long-chain acyl-CoA synthetase